MDSSAWDRRYAARELVWTAEPNRFVADELSALPPGRALDLATGEGRNAIWLASKGWRVTAVDFSSVALDKARRLAADRRITVDWVHDDVLTYQPEPGGYDLVVLAYLHMQAAEMAEVLRRAAGGLAVGGTFLLVGHDLSNLIEGTGGPPDPAVLYTPESIVAELSGLRITVAERVRRPVASESGSPEAIDTLVRAVREPGNGSTR
jgi:SAM-dependent methyltransferase